MNALLCSNSDVSDLDSDGFSLLTFKGRDCCQLGSPRRVPSDRHLSNSLYNSILRIIFPIGMLIAFSARRGRGPGRILPTLLYTPNILTRRSPLDSQEEILFRVRNHRGHGQNYWPLLLVEERLWQNF